MGTTRRFLTDKDLFLSEDILKDIDEWSNQSANDEQVFEFLEKIRQEESTTRDRANEVVKRHVPSLRN